MMLVPIAGVDLYELSNNSVWRTNFGFRNAAVKPGAWMDVETENGGMTEWGWLNFGFENYYTLLNCGFRLQPTAGTASGVHPVPLGYSRVYVNTGDEFSPDAWISGLRNGRSFVTTGPMLLATLNDALPGEVFEQAGDGARRYHLEVQSISHQPVDRIEVIVNGRIEHTFRPALVRGNPQGGFESSHQLTFAVDESSWVAVRSVQVGADDRKRFAHTAPWHIEAGGKPVRPRAEEVEYLVSRVQAEIDRNRDVLSPEALAEFEEALRIYESLRERVR